MRNVRRVRSKWLIALIALFAVSTLAAMVPVRAFMGHAGQDFLRVFSATELELEESRFLSDTSMEELLSTGDYFSAEAVNSELDHNWGRIVVEWGDQLNKPLPDRWAVGGKMREEDRQPLGDSLSLGTITDDEGNVLAQHYYAVQPRWRIMWSVPASLSPEQGTQAEQILRAIANPTDRRIGPEQPPTTEQLLRSYRLLFMEDIGEFAEGAVARVLYEGGRYILVDLALLASYSLRNLALALWLPLLAPVPLQFVGAAVTTLMVAKAAATLWLVYRLAT